MASRFGQDVHNARVLTAVRKAVHVHPSAKEKDERRRMEKKIEGKWLGEQGCNTATSNPITPTPRSLLLLLLLLLSSSSYFFFSSSSFFFILLLFSSSSSSAIYGKASSREPVAEPGVAWFGLVDTIWTLTPCDTLVHCHRTRSPRRMRAYAGSNPASVICGGDKKVKKKE